MLVVPKIDRRVTKVAPRHVEIVHPNEKKKIIYRRISFEAVLTAGFSTQRTK